MRWWRRSPGGGSARAGAPARRWRRPSHRRCRPSPRQSRGRDRRPAAAGRSRMRPRRRRRPRRSRRRRPRDSLPRRHRRRCAACSGQASPWSGLHDVTICARPPGRRPRSARGAGTRAGVAGDASHSAAHASGVVARCAPSASGAQVVTSASRSAAAMAPSASERARRSASRMAARPASTGEPSRIAAERDVPLVAGAFGDGSAPLALGGNGCADLPCGRGRSRGLVSVFGGRVGGEHRAVVRLAAALGRIRHGLSPVCRDRKGRVWKSGCRGASRRSAEADAGRIAPVVITARLERERADRVHHPVSGGFCRGEDTPCPEPGEHVSPLNTAQARHRVHEALARIVHDGLKLGAARPRCPDPVALAGETAESTSTTRAPMRSSTGSMSMVADDGAHGADHRAGRGADRRRTARQPIGRRAPEAAHLRRHRLLGGRGTDGVRTLVAPLHQPAGESMSRMMRDTRGCASARARSDLISS